MPLLILFVFCEATNQLGILLPKLSNTCFLFSPPPFSRHFCLFWFWATSNFNATRYHCKNHDKLVQNFHKNRPRPTATPKYIFRTFFMHTFLALQFSVKPIHCHLKMACTVMTKVYQTPTVVNLLLSVCTVTVLYMI